ncbi:methylated-DNA--[protein]-cysteine S-methyltransferase [Dokdonella sp.]|uniref:methylated-DNA--[protein]-cysteine S-methyltransferase n=1 Tax=Dokdonella sp. TaxID=2291710 RepID=UPI001B231B38|nr:methylated-DNA--[protein]-cysteine S-methyltransferase [Dokdonella sp.]MBO9662759.1 methylated-DNA--[protein]-cysteine S-methyltransferase [Dokdonella sp.]
MQPVPSPAFRYHFRAPDSPVDGPIRFAVGRTALGAILVGRSRRGVCAILLGENAQALRDRLAVAFPEIELQADRRSLRRELRQVVACVEGETSEDAVDLDIGGTDFEQNVWRALSGIPAGRTRSYGDVAQDLGAPTAARAVAGACAANLLALAIPCHRVVRRDGAIAGYRWGTERKRALLAREGVR